MRFPNRLAPKKGCEYVSENLVEMDRAVVADLRGTYMCTSKMWPTGFQSSSNDFAKLCVSRLRSQILRLLAVSITQKIAVENLPIGELSEHILCISSLLLPS